MAKPFDISKFRKDITKAIDGLSIGFNDPTDWVSTGNHALNYLISGDFGKGVPLGKVTVFAGESGSGKSTLLNLIAGFEFPTAGQLQVDGQSVKAPGPARVRNVTLRARSVQRIARILRLAMARAHVQLARHDIGNEPRAVFAQQGDFAFGLLECVVKAAQLVP